MFDEGLCLVCGSPLTSDAVYCSLECSVVDSSSSSYSAPSSSHPSPQVFPADRVSSAADMPGLVYSHRNRPSLSSTSTVDSDEYVYGDMSNINFNRRPGTTNSRGVIPTLGHRPSSNRRLSSNTADSSYVRFREEETFSSYAKAKAWKDAFATTSPSPIPPPTFLDSTSSDDEYPSTFINSQQETLKRRTSFKQLHRVSLPAYFSRLSIDPSTRSPDALIPIDQAQSLPSSKSSKSSPRSRSTFSASISNSTSTVVGAFKGITPTAVHPTSSLTQAEIIHNSSTPRGRGRERRARVRQGASRSPPGHRHHSRSISSLDISPSRSPSPQPAIPLLPQNEVAQRGRAVERGRGRNPFPRALAAIPTANVPQCGSLGGRITREAHVHHVQHQPQYTSMKNIASITKEKDEDEMANRGRRTREEVSDCGEERERGRSRLVVRRRSKNPPPTLVQ